MELRCAAMTPEGKRNVCRIQKKEQNGARMRINDPEV